MERCTAVNEQGERCALWEGHEGNHTLLAETGAPWLYSDDPSPAMKGPKQEVARSLTYGELRAEIGRLTAQVKEARCIIAALASVVNRWTHRVNYADIGRIADKANEWLAANPEEK